MRRRQRHRAEARALESALLGLDVLGQFASFRQDQLYAQRAGDAARRLAAGGEPAGEALPPCTCGTAWHRADCPQNTWSCHVCGETRPDAQIATYPMAYDPGVGGVLARVSVRYCADRLDCREGAPAVARRWIARTPGAGTVVE